jgi:hypothetical protein
MKKLLLIIAAIIIGFSSLVYSECIEGNCKTGKGTWTYGDGEMPNDDHFGVWKNGTYYREQDSPAGNKYVGEWKNNLYHGIGTFTSAEGDIYIGQWEKGLPNGIGEFTSVNGDKYIGEWKDGKIVKNQSVIIKGNGLCKSGNCLNGKGTWVHPTKGIYIGQFKDGKFNGQGTLICPLGYTAIGYKYTGEWKDGEWHGKGELVYADGRKEIGTWKNGLRHGQGAIWSADEKLLFKEKWEQTGN